MRYFLIIVGLLLTLMGCSGNFEENRARLDEVYGECNNPVRPLSTRKYKECLAKERGGEGSFFDDLDNSFGNAFGNNNSNIVYLNAVNADLWQAALDVTKIYPLKIADNQGGLIETQWIINANSPSSRCLIKIRVMSPELVSNGVQTNFICEEKINDAWLNTNQDYSDEEKQITLKILSTASELSNSRT